MAQTGCSLNNVQTCNVPAGSGNYIQTYDGAITISNSNVLSAGVNGSAAQAIQAQSFGFEGSQDSNGNGQLGSQAFAVIINNSGGITIESDQQTATTPFAGLYANALAGNGGPANSYKDNAAAGENVLTAPFINNSGAIAVNGFNPADAGGAALLATSAGGNSGNVPSNGTDGNGNPEYDGTGSSGGQGAGATIINSGAINVTANGAVGYAGIEASGTGGAGGAGKDGGYGGGGGIASITNSGNVNVNWSWTATSKSDSGAFGILASSRGGDGSSSYQSQINGGAGGAAQGAGITITKGGDVSLTSTTGYTGQTINTTFLTPYIPPVPVPQPDDFETVISSASAFDAASSGFTVTNNTAVIGAGVAARLIGGVGGNG